MRSALLQSASAAGQSLPLLAFLAVSVAVVLSVVVLLKGLQGYRRAGDPALAGLAVGILLLSGVPLLVNLVLTTTGTASPEAASVLSDATQLTGLGVILYVIYRTGP